MKRLSDEQLLGELQSLKDRECETTAAILYDLIEVERRKLHFKLGYASLFAFATQHLRYSESAAGRRIQAARCIRSHPEVMGLLERGAVNLSTIATVSGILSDTNKDELLATIRGKSQREVEALVVAAKPATRVRDRVRVVNVPVSQPPRPALEKQWGTAPEDKEPRETDTGRGAQLSQGCKGSGTPKTSVPCGTNHSLSGSDTLNNSPGVAHVEQQFMVQFAARGEFMQKFEEARALLSGRLPKGVPFAAVFEAALDALLEKKSPIRRKARREQRAAQRQAGATPKASATSTARMASAARKERESQGQQAREVERGARNARDETDARSRRHIPTAVRDAVFARDGGHCTYVGVDGRRCGSRHDVEIDHEKPLARGGTNAIGNLRLLCARHNRLEAERVYGMKWMRRFSAGAAGSIG